MTELTWRALNHVLRDKTEAEVWQMLEDERDGDRRHVVLIRLHQRYTKLRGLRERDALLRPRP